MREYIEITKRNSITDESQKIVLKSILSGTLDNQSSIARAYRWPESRMSNAIKALINKKLLKITDGKLEFIKNKRKV